MILKLNFEECIGISQTNEEEVLYPRLVTYPQPLKTPTYVSIAQEGAHKG